MSVTPRNHSIGLGFQILLVVLTVGHTSINCHLTSWCYTLVWLFHHYRAGG